MIRLATNNYQNIIAKCLCQLFFWKRELESSLIKMDRLPSLPVTVLAVLNVM